MTAGSDLPIIDDLGVTAVAKALDITREAVRQRRIKGNIPDHCREELWRLIENDIGSDGRPVWPRRRWTSTAASRRCEMHCRRPDWLELVRESVSTATRPHYL